MVTVAAALAAVLLAQKFGRTAKTDGFLAAYGVYLLFMLAAQGVRIVLVPELTRAVRDGKLAEESVAYAVSLLAFALPAFVLVALLRHPIAEAVTGSLPEQSADVAARALPWLIAAAAAQLLAAVLASALAASDSYGVAAVAYATGSLAGVGLFAVLADGHGLQSLAWGLALNGIVTAGIPILVLAARRAGGRRMPRPSSLHVRLGRLARATAVPLSLQGLYLIALRLAADLEVGKVTSLSYGYLIATVLVATTAASLGVVSSAPLTRRGLDPESAAAHIVHASWLSVAIIMAGVGVFALAGARIVGLVLGGAFSGGAGRELGRLIVYLAPWMVASVALTLTFPLLFVVGRSKMLIPIALVMPPLEILVGVPLRDLAGLPGIALALAIATVAGLVGLLASLSPRTLLAGARGLGRLTLVEAGLAAIAFGVLALVLGGVAAAVAGLVVYTAALAALRPRGLRDAWAYVRALH